MIPPVIPATLYLDAVRAGDTLVLAGRGDAHGPRAEWQNLAPGIEGRPSGPGERSAISWEREGPAEGLAALSLDDDGEYLARLPAGATWDPALASVTSPVSSALGEVGLWTVAFRGRAGAAVLRATLADRVIVAVPVEVRAPKLGRLEDYRAMLDDLGAVRWGEALSLAPAATPTTAALRPHGSGALAPGARSSWETFLVLRFLARNPALAAAVEIIRRHPVTHLVATRRAVRPEHAGWARPEDIAAHAGTGRRCGTSLPETVWEAAPGATLDTPENRFVLHALRTLEALAAALATDAREPTLHGASLDLAVTFEHLARGLFGGPVAPLGDSFHLASEALQRRPGYREVLAAWRVAQDAGVTAQWDRGDPVQESVRDTATLYERWCTVEIGRALGARDDAIARALAGDAVTVSVAGGATVILHPQRSYARGDGSYSMAFRPDVTVEAGDRRLLLDAKYQVDRAAEALGAGRSGHPASGVVKMHAYRDSIDGTWGAAALFPGAGVSPIWFEEPSGSGGGVGALPLRPGADGALRTAQRQGLRALVGRFVALALPARR